jgi:hypothetical protein
MMTRHDYTRAAHPQHPIDPVFPVENVANSDARNWNLLDQHPASALLIVHVGTAHVKAPCSVRVQRGRS